MKYYIRLLRSRAFKKAPFQTILRAFHLAFLVLMKQGKVIKVPFGNSAFKFDYVHGQRNRGGRGIFLYRNRIEDLMEFGDQFMDPGDVVIDGGANQGIFTMAFASRVGAEGQVVAFEPMAYAAERIRRNAEVNGFGHVAVMQKGLSDTAGNTLLDVSRGVGSASITNDYGGAETVDIEITTIDETVAQLGLSRVDFIKLDIEGAELKALHGAVGTIERFWPTFCLEISTGSGSDVERAAHEHLLALGYSAHEFSGEVLVPLAALAPPHPNIFYLRNGSE